MSDYKKFWGTLRWAIPNDEVIQALRDKGHDIPLGARIAANDAVYRDEVGFFVDMHDLKSMRETVEIFGVDSLAESNR